MKKSLLTTLLVSTSITIGCKDNTQSTQNAAPQNVTVSKSIASAPVISPAEQIANYFISQLNQTGYVLNVGLPDAFLDKANTKVLMDVCDSTNGRITSNISMYSSGIISWFGNNILTCQIPIIFKLKSVKQKGDVVSIVYSQNVVNPKSLYVINRASTFIDYGHTINYAHGAVVYSMDLHSSSIDNQVANLGDYATLLSKDYFNAERN